MTSTSTVAGYLAAGTYTPRINGVRNSCAKSKNIQELCQGFRYNGKRPKLVDRGVLTEEMMMQFCTWAEKPGSPNEHVNLQGLVALMFYGGLQFSQAMRLKRNDLQKQGKKYIIWLRADKRRTEAQRNKQNGHYKEVNDDFIRWFEACKPEDS